MKQADEISIFIINEDQLLVDALKNEIENTFAFYRISIKAFSSGRQCELFMKQTSRPDIVIVDYRFQEGLKITDMVKAANPQAEVIILTNEESAEIAVKALEHGVHDYIVKNDHLFKRIKITLLQCIKVTQLRKNMKKQVSLGIFTIIVIFLMFGVAVGFRFYVPESF